MSSRPNHADRAVRVDAHQHFWSLVRGDYRWLTPEFGPIYRDFGPKDLAPKLAEFSIDATVAVQAADTTGETAHLLALAESNAFIAGVVGWIDFEARDASDAAAELASNAKLVGLRPMIQDIADERWIAKRSLDRAFDAMVELDLCFDALVKLEHLPHLVDRLVRHPKLHAVIDHGAKPRIADGGTKWAGFASWREHMRRLARETRAFVKLSGLATEAAADWRADELRPFVDVLLENFGPSRILWGSDWPVVDLAGGYARWREATDLLLLSLSSAERDSILGLNALAFYGLQLPAHVAAPRG